MQAKIRNLTIEVQQKLVDVLLELDSLKINYYIVETKRGNLVQFSYFLSGRANIKIVNFFRKLAGLYKIDDKSNNIVTNCDGVFTKSRHQLGTALDVVPMVNGNPIWPASNDPRWKQISQVFKAHGFEWGGDWTDFVDCSHYQYISKEHL